MNLPWLCSMGTPKLTQIIENHVNLLVGYSARLLRDHCIDKLWLSAKKTAVMLVVVLILSSEGEHSREEWGKISCFLLTSTYSIGNTRQK